MMKTFLVGYKCVNKKERTGCECTIDVEDEVKEAYRKENKFDYDENCYYDFVKTDGVVDYETAIQQQSATEAESARDIWIDIEVIKEIH